MKLIFLRIKDDNLIIKQYNKQQTKNNERRN